MFFQSVGVDVKLATMRMLVLHVLRITIKPWMAKIIFASVNIDIFIYNCDILKFSATVLRVQLIFYVKLQRVALQTLEDK